MSETEKFNPESEPKSKSEVIKKQITDLLSKADGFYSEGNQIGKDKRFFELERSIALYEMYLEQINLKRHLWETVSAEGKNIDNFSELPSGEELNAFFELQLYVEWSPERKANFYGERHIDPKFPPELSQRAIKYMPEKKALTKTLDDLLDEWRGTGQTKENEILAKKDEAVRLLDEAESIINEALTCLERAESSNPERK